MTSLTQIPVNEHTSFLRVESDKLFVGGILSTMSSTIYKKGVSPLCNKCGIRPKYPTQGLCKECFFKKVHDKWVNSRPEKTPVASLCGETWKNIVGAEGYQVSNFGRIKSLNYYEEKGREHLLKLRESRKGGYLKADLDKYNFRPSIHRLVAVHFIPNPDNLPNVLHKDNNKQNNRHTNLYWGTQSRNMKDYVEYVRKVGAARAMLSQKEVLEIYTSSETVQAISLKYNTTPCNVWSIKVGRTWSKITGAISSRKYKKRTR